MVHLFFLVLLAALPCCAQNFTQRGFLEVHGAAYPQTAPNDSSHGIGEALFRYEALYKPRPWLHLNGAFDARTDTHREVERAWHFDWRDRGLRRPAFSLRRVSASFNRKGLSLEVGKQFIRWGKADILNPTDRFAPRDFLAVTDTDFLGVTGARAIYEAKSETVDVIWMPLFTPSRTPLFNQRWAVLPEVTLDALGARIFELLLGLPGAVLPGRVPIRDLGARYPGGSQFGARWNHLGQRFEGSLSFFQGFNNLPLFEPSLQLLPVATTNSIPPALLFRPVTGFRRFYPTMRMYGADGAAPLPWFTVKAEGGYFTSRTPAADEYVLYVIQAERQWGEWSFVGGYAGEAVTHRPTVGIFSAVSGGLVFKTASPETGSTATGFAPDRGLSRSFVAHVSYTIDANRSVAAETVIRQNGAGVLVKAEYSHLLGQHWRAIANLVIIAGRNNDFIGQYNRNSHANLTFRYSF